MLLILIRSQFYLLDSIIRIEYFIEVLGRIYISSHSTFIFSFVIKDILKHWGLLNRLCLVRRLLNILLILIQIQILTIIKYPITSDSCISSSFASLNRLYQFLQIQHLSISILIMIWTIDDISYYSNRIKAQFFSQFLK